MAPLDEEDIQLMCRAREGDVDAFTTLCARHRRRVESFLYRLFRDRESAADGAQEVLLRVWMARRRYEPRARFTTFLYQVAHNYWLDELRKARARPEEVSFDDGLENPPGRLLLPAPAAMEPHEHLFLRYRQWQIQEAIARLPEIYRLAFVLAHLEGHKIAEIAEILEIPEGTVKSRLHTATRKLRRWLLSEESEEER
ncbi:MAG: sigma-70 family RNA polymerase sigma factor [Armatimonadetes bacterium]|nr:sigma-70 family RNA polymerase sigma factor [Armatimonadota bacterium]